MRFINNLKTIYKLLLSNGIPVLCLLVVAVLAGRNMNQLNNYVDELYKQRLLPVYQLEEMETSMYTVRGDVYKLLLIPAEAETSKANIEKNLSVIDEDIKKFAAFDLTEADKVELATLKQSFQSYQEGVSDIIQLSDQGKLNDAIDLLEDGGKTATARRAVGTSTDALITASVSRAEELWLTANNDYAQALRLFVIITGVVLLLGVALIVMITTSLNQPIQRISKSLMNVSQGDLNRDLPAEVKLAIANRKDEIGTLAKAMMNAEDYMTCMADVASHISEGDLTVQVTPNSIKDELGIAFDTMVCFLRETMESISQSTITLSEAAQMLSLASNQAGQATNQIATTMQQVAKGAAQSSESVTTTTNSMEQMARAIDGVAKGAQEQASAATRASDITNLISSAISQVTGNVRAVANESAAAASAAREGSRTVAETLDGMNSIKEKVDISAAKVQEMGSRSNEINEIVTTIEDIASQTNLLALNAAIEAARAGESGKGFAVVAEEVRKLAERTAVATREIGSLIKGIQFTVSGAVTAMEDGAREVHSGVIRAGKAGEALAEILKAAESVNLQAEQAGSASEHVLVSAQDLVEAVTTVSAVVEENTASTEQMAAGSTEILQEIENIASISEENTAAVEEVSASTEEMNAQVEEVHASALELENLAATLKAVVIRFRF